VRESECSPSRQQSDQHRRSGESEGERLITLLSWRGVRRFEGGQRSCQTSREVIALLHEEFQLVRIAEQ
jgi:hypothetical protein